MASINPSEAAVPIQAHGINKRGPADIPVGVGIVDFVPPPLKGALRVRPAAHSVDGEYLKKYTKAVELMHALPADDPRNFLQQANVHRAYYDGTYDQIGFPNLNLEVHNSWLFFPWHRFYLYFYERILGKLIGDDSFAIPFWNWDSPAGKQLPAFYTNKSSYLYYPARDPAHPPPNIIDHDNLPIFTNDQVIHDKLSIMYRQIVTNSKTREPFFGAAYRADDQPIPWAGSIERGSHSQVHNWTGNPANPNVEDMGKFHFSARDAVFYELHANVDRLWTVWEKLGHTLQDFADGDWFSTSFLFYDEDAQLVRVKVRDCISTDKLGYKYEEVENPW